MRLIDPIELKRSIAFSSMVHDGKTLEQIIDEQLSVEPEIIHCKDCKHYEHDVGNEEYGVCCNSQWVVGNVGCGVTSNDFCSYVERRSNETD